MSGYPPMGRDGYLQLIGMFSNAFSEWRVTTDDQVAEGDLVVNRWTTYGTHNGDFNGIPPTGKAIKAAFIDMWRLENGKAAENWVQIDMMGLLQQLGVMPAPQAA